MPEIQIVLTTDNSLFARIARWLGAEWTHAMLRFSSVDIAAKSYDRGVWAGYEERPHIIEAGFRHGVVERRWDSSEYSKWAVYAAKPFYITPRHHQTILDYARGNVGKWYAFDRLILLLPQFLHAVLANTLAKVRTTRQETRMSMLFIGQRAHICSSLVDDSFSASGLDLVRKHDTPWVLPDDIRDSPLLEKIEEG